MKTSVGVDAADAVSVLPFNSRATCGQSVGGFPEKLAALLPHAHRLVVDLSEVEHIDDAALGQLVMVLLWAQASGCVLKLAAPTLSVYRLLELTTLLEIFETHPTVEEAVLSFRQSPKKAKAAACTAA